MAQKIEFNTIVTDKIIDDYKNGDSMSVLGKRYGVSTTTIWRFLKDNGVITRPWPCPVYRINENVFDSIDKLINDYKNGDSLSLLAKRYGVGVTSIWRILRKNGVITRPNRIYKINEDVFDLIDTELKAYTLGFIYADGNIKGHKNTSYSFRMELAKADLSILQSISTLFYNGKPSITYREPRTSTFCGGRKCTNTGSYVLNVNNKRVYEALIKLGFGLKHERNAIPSMPEDLKHHFIRGLFDGDGCVSTIGKHYRYDLMGTKPLLTEIAEYLEGMGCDKFNISHYKSYCHKMSKGGRVNVAFFRDIIYKDATIFLARKYDKFKVIGESVNLRNKASIYNPNTIYGRSSINDICIITSTAFPFQPTGIVNMRPSQ